jgi:hypothetical protein
MASTRTTSPHRDVAGVDGTAMRAGAGIFRLHEALMDHATIGRGGSVTEQALEERRAHPPDRQIGRSDVGRAWDRTGCRG